MIRILLLITVILTTISKHSILGRWESKSATGNTTGVVFKEDHSFEAYVNRKPFTTGKYYMHGDTLHFNDTGCGGSEGIYKTNFFADGDSLYWAAISDTCTERRNGMQRLRMGMVKN